MLRKWIRIPGGGELRGGGTWHLVKGDLMEEDFARHKLTGYLPIAWEIPEAVIVRDPMGGEPKYIVLNDAMVDQFFRIATPLSARTAQAIKAAQSQIANLLEIELVIDMEKSDDKTIAVV